MQFFTQASLTRQAEQRSRQSYQCAQYTRTAQHYIIGEKACKHRYGKQCQPHATPQRIEAEGFGKRHYIYFPD